MRVPKMLNPRIQKQLLMKFGVYEVVSPAMVTPSRVVPKNIPRPYNLRMNSCLEVPELAEIKDKKQITGMKNSCKLASSILAQVEAIIKPGKTTDEIDQFVHNKTIEAGAYPSPLYYKGYPKSICTSVNNVAVHGIPDLRPLQNGDIVNVDITVFFEDYHGDCSKTFLVGDVDDRGLQLVQVTNECLDIGLNTCGPNVPFSEIGAQIQRHAKNNGLTALPGILGHGIGQYFHGPPDIYHTRNKYPGLMEPGMTFTIEPALSHGEEVTVLLEDGWTIVTADDARSAQAEHTILVTENGAEILTN